MSRAKTMKTLLTIVLLFGFAHVAIADNNNGNNNNNGGNNNGNNNNGNNNNGGNNNDDRVSRDMPKGTPTTWVDVIIQFKSVSTKDGSKDLDSLLRDINKQSDDEFQKGQQQGQNGQQKGNHKDKKFDAIKAINRENPSQHGCDPESQSAC